MLCEEAPGVRLKTAMALLRLAGVAVGLAMITKVWTRCLV